jgi:hypothetical protein
MQSILLKDVKKGEFIKRKPDAKKVYTRGEYDRAEKRFTCDDWDDISRAVYLKGSTTVFVDFEF